VQQALRLLQMSALEFAQEMEQALSENPFLEEKETTPDGAPAAPGEAPADAGETQVESSPPGLDDLAPAGESSGSGSDRAQPGEGAGVADPPPSAHDTL